MTKPILALFLLLTLTVLVKAQNIDTYAGGGPNNVPATAANVSSPTAVAVDADGNVYIASPQLFRIFKVNVGTGTLTLVAGNGTNGFSGDGGPATSASLGPCWGVAVDALGNIYLADRSNQRIRKVNNAGIISTVAGSGSTSFGGDGGPATSAGLSAPFGIAVDASGNLYIADSHRIRKVNIGGTILTVAGDGNPGFVGDGGPAIIARLNNPMGLSVDASGNLYISDRDNNRVRKVSTSGTISTFAGNGLATFSGDGGPANSRAVNSPNGVAVDPSGNVYIADRGNQRIRKVNSAGNISTFAGNGSASFSGDGGPATAAGFSNPQGVALDTSGNVCFGSDGRIRRVDVLGTISTFAGNGFFGYSGDGGLATSASINNPIGLALDISNSLYIADRGNNAIRKISTSGVISTVAGSGTGGFSGDGLPATSARLQDPYAVAVDAVGNIYIADTSNNRIRKVNTAGIISTVAGNGNFGFLGDGGAATSARLASPTSVAVDAAGNIYIADANNHRVRKIDPGGIISTFAGNGSAGFSGDGFPALSASLNSPLGVALDPTGNVYIADLNNHRIRKVSTSGIISTVAGTGIAGFSGDGAAATLARINTPYAIAVSAGSLYIADQGNSRIRKIDLNGIISTVAGNGLFTYAGDGGPATSASFAFPIGVAVDAWSNLYIADFSNHRVRRVQFMVSTTVTVTCAPGPFTYDSSAQTPCTATVTDGGSLNQSLTVNYSNNVDAGTATASASYAGDANHNASSDSTNFTIAKAATTTTVTCAAGPFTYDGSAQTPCSASVTGGGSLNQSLTVNYTNNISAGSATASASYSGDANHDSSSDSTNFTIAKANSTTTVTCAAGPFTYNGSAQSPCTASVTGVGSLGQSLPVNYTNNVSAGTATASASYSGDVNHNASTDSTNFTIAKASPTTTVACAAGPFTYDGSAQTPCTASVNGVGLNQSLAVNYTNNTNAGSATASASFDGDANHNASSDSTNFAIAKANSTTTVTCAAGPFPYDGSAQSPCAASVTGNGLNQSLTVNYTSNVNAGTATASAAYAGDANHTGSNDAKNFTITHASSTVTVSCPTNVSYDGLTQAPCTASVTGAGGLNQSLTVNYSNNVSAGTATASAAYSGDANHNASSDSTNFTISKASSTTTVTCAAGPFVYDGSGQTPCSATVSGIGGLSQSLTVNYSNNTDAGSASAMASFDGDANHDASSDTKSFEIGKADSNAVVTCPSSQVYAGSAIEPCTVSVTGAGGLNLTPVPNYASNVNVGTATASYSYSGDANHNPGTASKDFAISKATSTTTISCPGNINYTGLALEPCTASVTGAGGLNQLLPVNYSNNTNAGNASASASYAGDANHSGGDDSMVFTIDKASSTATMNCAAGPYTYTGAAQTPCTAIVTGAGGLNQSLTVNYTDNVNAGTAIASASFTGDVNHTSSNESQNFTINKAQLTVTADNKSMIFGSTTPPTFTAFYSGFVGGQTAGSLGFVPAFNVMTMPLPGSAQTVGSGTPVGTYAIVPNGLTSNNYSFTYNYGLLTVGVWTITGFYQPVDMSVSGYVINTVKGGSTVPLKFNIYAGTPGPLTERKSVTDVLFGAVQFAEYPCAQTPGFETPLEISNTGNTSLRYDTTGAQFIQNWQTPKAPNKCYQVRMTALDGSHIDAYFKTK